MECVNGSLEVWKEMVDSIFDEMIFEWFGKIEVFCFEVCATFLNGDVLVEEKGLFEYWKRFRRAIKEMIKSFVRESVIGFAGVKEDKFSKADIDCYRLD